MTARTKSILKSGIFAIAVGALVFFTNPQGSGDLFRRICDAFFTPGALLLGSAGLTWCRNRGAFDLLTYGVTSVFHTHVPGASIGHARDEKEETHSILAAIKQFKEAPPTPYKEKAGPSHEER